MNFHQAVLLSVFSEAQGNNRKQRDVGVEVINNVIRNFFTQPAPWSGKSQASWSSGQWGLPPSPPEHSSVVNVHHGDVSLQQNWKPLNYKEGAMDAFLLKSTKAFHLTE